MAIAGVSALLIGVLSVSAAGAKSSPWKQVGDELKIDLPAGFGSFRDLDRDRAGTQIKVRVLVNASEHRLRFVASDETVVGEAADGGFVPQDSLGAGRRAFAWGVDASGGSARLWAPAFDAARTLLFVDPQLPCGEALDRRIPLAGPFTITIPAGARPGGATIASPADVFVYGGLRHHGRGVLITTGSGQELGERRGHTIARGGFAFANAVFAYGGAGKHARLWTPELEGRSTELEQTGFVPCDTRKFDGNVTPVKDIAHAASAAIGPAGGTVTASGMTLSVPPGALHDLQTITLTPLSSIGGSPFHELIGAVEMKPEGLHFLIPATLTIPRPAGLLDSQIVGFGFSAGGTGFHLKPNDHSSGPIVLQVLHFSGGGAANASPTEVNYTLGYQPTPAQELAEQQIAAAQNQFPNLNDQLIPTFNALNDWFDHSVSPGLQVVGDSLDNLELALGEWVAWVGEVEAFRANFSLPTAFSQDIAFGQARASDDAAHIADLVLAGCTGAGANPLESLRPVVRLSADLQAIEQARAIRLTIENTITPGGRRLPPATALPSSCLHVKIESITHAPALAFVHENSYTADAGVVFWNATSANHSIPLVLTLLDQTEVVIPPTVVTNGHLKTTVSPTLLGSRAHVLIAKLEAAEADDTLKPLSDQKIETVPVRPRIDLRSDATIKPGDTVHLKTLLAGDGMVNGTVTYVIAGVGSLSAGSGTTDATGETDVDYTAPPDNHPGEGRITASFDDGTGAIEGFAKITIKPDVKVVVTPATAQLSAGGTKQFSAAVTGVNDPSVTWTKTAGTIDQTGLYTAPPTAGTYTITATSNEDPTAKDSATITVTAPAISGTLGGTDGCGNFEGVCTWSAAGSFQLSLTARLDANGNVVIESLTGQYNRTSTLLFNTSELQIPCPLLSFSGSAAPPVVGTPSLNSATLTALRVNFVGTASVCGLTAPTSESLPLRVTRVVQAGRLVGLDFNATYFVDTASLEHLTLTVSGFIPVM